MSNDDRSIKKLDYIEALLKKQDVETNKAPWTSVIIFGFGLPITGGIGFLQDLSISDFALVNLVDAFEGTGLALVLGGLFVVIMGNRKLHKIEETKSI